MKKGLYKSAMSRLKTSEHFQQETEQKLLLAMERNRLDTTRSITGRIQMEAARQKTRVQWTIGLTACAVLIAGMFMFNINSNQQNEPPAGGEQPPVSTTQPPVSATQPPVKGKGAVNIEGVITEVGADGNSFKVGDLWVTVTDQTGMGIQGPTAAPPSEELLQKEFRVGNLVSGYTSQDVSSGKVTADVIYNNMVLAPAE